MRILREDTGKGQKVVVFINGKVDHITHFRDKNSICCISSTCYYPDNSTKSISHGDRWGNDSIRITFYKDGSLESSSIAEYDSSGNYKRNCIQNFYTDGTLESEGYEFKEYRFGEWSYYDFDGSKIYSIQFDSSGLCRIVHRYLFDFTPGEHNFYYLRTEYQYHKNGNVQRVTKYKGLYLQFTYTEETYPDGSIGQGESGLSYSGLIGGILTEELIYDRSGLLIKTSPAAR